jgi:phospho-N-acetylmuramoyl-pentapeptide-transferase
VFFLFTIHSYMIQILRVFCASLVSGWITFFAGRFLIGYLTRKRAQVPIKPELAQEQAGKAGTPSMGGISFLVGITISVLLLGDITDEYTWIPLVGMWLFGIVGMIDDLLKIKRQNSDGLKSGQKLAMQVLCAATVISLMTLFSDLQETLVTIPWNPAKSIDIGGWYRLAALVYMLYFVNAVNITDGLDGLAAGNAFPVVLMITVVSAIFGYGIYGDYIQPTVAAGGVDLAIVGAAVLGSLLAFLWFNTKPAQMFMGDCGSHAIGALIAISALLLKIELVVLVASGVFLIEFATSFIQILAIRTKGKKVFPIAPLHHVYERKGLSENKIVDRFRIVGYLCVVIASILFLVKYI